MSDNKTPPEQIGYSKGYAAGQKRLKRETQIAHDIGYQEGLKAGGWKPIPPHVQRYDALMATTLNTVLQHCSGWSINGEKLHNAEGFVTLAKIFVDEQIKVGPKILPTPPEGGK